MGRCELGHGRRGHGRNDHGYVIYDQDDAGPQLPVLLLGGAFSFAGGAPAQNMATWNGSSWAPFGGGASALVDDFAIFDADGPGGAAPLLIAGGDFAMIGGVSAARIAAWNGSTWTGLGTGMDFNVIALAAFDEDGSGPGPLRLYAGGNFTTAGGVLVNQIAAWDGTTWSSLDAGTNSLVASLLAAQDGSAGSPPTLFAGGFFATPASRVAAWVGCELPCTTDWNGDDVPNSQDFFDFLGDFFAGVADFNADGMTDSQDLLDFLSAFFAGC